jgi:uncharacterized membrane protein
MFTTGHLHPMLVHFPIALIVIGFLAESTSYIVKRELYLQKVSFYLLLAGTLFAIFTWLSGVLFTPEMSGTAGTIKKTHQLFAVLTLGLLLLTSILRVLLTRYADNQLLTRLSFTAYLLAAVCVVISGYYGGTLVYNYMMPL